MQPVKKIDFVMIICLDFDSFLKLELGEKERKKPFQSPKIDYSLMLHFPRLEPKVSQIRVRISTQVNITLGYTSKT